MLQIIRQLSVPDSLSALHNWIYGPPTENIVLSLVIRLRNAEDHEAEFLLNSLSQHRSQDLALALKEFEKTIANLETKRELKPSTLITTEDGDTFDVTALLDCGCTNSAINRKFVLEHNIPTKRLPFPRKSLNADNTPNKGGPITEYVSVRLDVCGHAEMRHLLVLDISNDVP